MQIAPLIPMLLRAVRAAGLVREGTRALCVEPRPTLTRATLAAEVSAAVTPRTHAMALRGIRGTRNWLSEVEQEVFGRARRTGVLRVTASCSQAVVEQYERWCYVERRPFVALNVHGNQVYFHAEPGAWFGSAVLSASICVVYGRHLRVVCVQLAAWGS
jgi:hypothetical protein